MSDIKVRAILIIEIAGRPAEHVKSSLESHVEKFGLLKDVKLISKNIAEPKRLESEQEMYTDFAEVEIETINLSKLIEVVFDFMPSSVEIIEPENLDFNCQEATMFLNDLSGRLHRYDEIAKVSQFQVQKLAKQLQFMNKQNKQPIQTTETQIKEPDKKSSKKKSKSKKSKS